MQRMSRTQLQNVFIPCPPSSEQTAIADYLDKKCAAIDTVIEKEQQVIEKLIEYKQSVITEAVTKGLNPDVPMKDSGIEWIGCLPDSWSVLALKYLCVMQAGKNLISEQIVVTGNYPVYGGNGQRGFFGKYNYEGKKLIVGRQGALCGNVHRVNGQFWATEHAIVTENTYLCNIDYLYYLLIGMNLNKYVSSTAAQPGLAVSTIQNVRTCLPSIDEQEEIANYLDKKCLYIDSVITKKQLLIDKLTEYKKSLIYEMVTGKKEVPLC